MTVQPASPPGSAERVRDLLAAGKTAQYAADACGWPRQHVVAFINGTKNWLYDADTDKAVQFQPDPEPKDIPAMPQTSARPTARLRGSVDELLADAGDLDDKAVQREHAKALEAVGRLRQAVTTVTARIEAEQARAAALRVAQADLEKAQKELDDAKSRLKELTGKTRASSPVTRKPETVPASQATPQEIRAWAKERGIDCPQYGRIPIDIRQQYENQNGTTQ